MNQAYIQGLKDGFRKQAQLAQIAGQLGDPAAMAKDYAGKLIADKMKEKNVIQLLAGLGLLKSKADIGVVT